MQLYSIEDFRPTPSKRASRINLVNEAIRLAVDMYRTIALRDYGVENAVSTIPDAAESFVDEYFDHVARFKIRHGFIPGERINPPKIAALLLRTAGTRSWGKLFSRQSTVISDDFMKKLYYEFAYQLTSSICFIREDAINNDHQRDFYICMNQEKFMTDEWACWMMVGFVKAFGEEIPVEE